MPFSLSWGRISLATLMGTAKPTPADCGTPRVMISVLIPTPRRVSGPGRAAVERPHPPVIRKISPGRPAVHTRCLPTDVAVSAHETQRAVTQGNRRCSTTAISVSAAA
jgi:hypothetical protein